MLINSKSYITLNSTSPNKEHLIPWNSISIQKYVLAGVLSILIAIIIVGNSFVILAVIKNKGLRTITNCFIVSLAVADWLVGAFVLPPAVAYHIIGTWKLGRLLCEIWLSFDILLCTASILNLCVISVDRYLAIKEPIKYSKRRRSRRVALSMIVFVWFSSILITCPPILGWYQANTRDAKECIYNINTGYVFYSAMGSFFLPTIVMVYMYVRISCIITARNAQPLRYKESSSRQNISSTSQAKNSLSGNDLESEHEKKKTLYNVSITPSTSSEKPITSPGFKSSEKINLAYAFNRESRTTKILCIVMGCYILCWLPFFIFYVLLPFLPPNDTTKLIMAYLVVLGWINSGINPLIFAFCSSEFRGAFLKIILWQAY